MIARSISRPGIGPVTSLAAVLGLGLWAAFCCSSGASAAPNYSAEVLSDLPIAYWRLNDASAPAAVDATGNSNGTYAGAMAFGQPSPIFADPTAASVDFQGGNMSATMTSSLQSRFSVEFWLQPGSLSNYNQVLGNNWGTFLFHSTSGGGVYTGNNCCGTGNRFEPSVVPNGTLQVGQWGHYVYTFDESLPTSASFYKNGSPAASLDLSTGASSWNVFNLSGSLDGLVAEVAVYDKALSAGRVAAHYDAGAPPPPPALVSPGGPGVLGTANYIGGNLILDDDENPATPNAAGLYPATTSSIDGVPTFWTWGTVTSNGNDGEGQNAGYSAAHTWHEDSQNHTPTRPTWFNVDLGELDGQPNAPNHSYAIDAVRVWGRTDCCGTQVQGLFDMFDEFGNPVATDLPVTFNSQSMPSFNVDLGPTTLFAGEVEFRTMVSFNELEVFGLADYTQRAQDLLQIDIGAGGNDFVYVGGDAVLGGTLGISLLGGYVPPQGATFDILTAASIDATNLVLGSPGFEHQVISGGNGQILQLTAVAAAIIPEPAALVIWAFGLAGLAWCGRRRRGSRGALPGSDS